MRRITLLLITVLLVKGAEAHLRDFLVTYGYYTPVKGEVELELWNRYGVADRMNPEQDYWVHSFEVELGLNDRWALGVYADFSRTLSGPLTYDAFRIEQRLRLSEAGRWLLDPTLYLEYKAPRDVSDEDKGEVEGKLILGKELGDLTLALNGIYERELESGSKNEFGYAFGLARSSFPSARAGLEFKGELAPEAEKHYVIPGIYIDIGKQKRLNLGASFGLTKESEPFGLRSILEIEF